MRRVLHAVGRFLSRTETFIYTMVTHHQRYEASVLCQSRLYGDEFPFSRVHVCAKPQSKRRVGWWVDASVARATGRSPWRRAVEAVLSDVQPDVVHAHFGPTACELAEITTAAGIPLVASLYGVDAAVLPYLPQWRDAYERLFAAGALFLAEAPEMRRKVIAAGAPADRTVIQPIAIDLTRYPRWAPPPEPRVLFAGRFIEKKGLLDAIAAFDRARRSQPAARLTIVGDGPDEADARTLVDRLGCRNVVEFVGSKPHGELIAMLAAAAVLIHPSATALDGDSEGGAPTILLEAQAIGTPIVSTRHADIPHVAPEGPGVRLCAEHDIAGLSEALAAVLAAPQASSDGCVAAHHAAPSAIARLEARYSGLLETAVAS
ncbi:MAG TPA: glycosyltransferase [Vicinamibacterales bacterium]|nr:glycosyltransferase [Vicinamibacterales bacterium]